MENGFSSSRSEQLVFAPAPLTGHIISTVDLAKLLLRRHHRLSVAILIIDFPFDPNATAYASSLAASLTDPRIRFISLPPPPTSPKNDASAAKPTAAGLVALIGAYKDRVRDAMASLGAEPESNSGRLAGIVLDMFSMPMLEVASELGVPSYLYYTSGAAVLGLALNLQSRRDDLGLELDEFVSSETELSLPSFARPVPLARVAPFVLNDKVASSAFFDRARGFRETKGILVNTFSELESHALDSFSKSGKSKMPPVYPMGPILNLTAHGSSGNHRRTEEEGIVRWLDGQPESSVVFLCFGSMGCFGGEQVREIAGGIERSGHRFLWSLRRPPPPEKIQPEEYEDPAEVLPEGFLKRTSEIGRVIGWAPQAAVLAHAAVGGFVSHCGWNSVLESVWFGVPIATWPMYAEQQVNAFAMARELGLAAEITVDYRIDLETGTANFTVKAEEVERGIRCVMEQDSEIRKRVRRMSEVSRKAVAGGGSSYKWVGRFLEAVINNAPSS